MGEDTHRRVQQLIAVNSMVEITSNELTKNGFVKHQICLAFQYSTPCQRYTNRVHLEDLLFQGACDDPTEKLSTFIDKLLQPIAQKQQSYMKDTTDLIS